VEQSPHQICCSISLDALRHSDSQSFNSGYRILLPKDEVAEISVILLHTDLQKRKNNLAALASLLALSMKSIVWPVESTVR